MIAEAVTAPQELRLAIPGIHLEGPYISSEDGPRGAHDPEFVRDPDWEEFSIWQEASRGMIRLVTLAPERPGAQEFIRRASASGVKVALGHTAADAMAIEAAVRAGASLSTHLGNGSHGLIPRLKNYIWEQLACDDLHASIITDGFHLPDSVIKAFWRTKGEKKIILASDVAVMGGKEPGVYRWGGIEVQVFADGHLGLAGTEYLAGAAHLLDWDIPRCIAATGCSLAEAIAACTVNPARYLGMKGSFARLKPGSPAHLVLFHWKPGDKRLQIQQTIRGGRTVYS
jgi:N-acetylglucosamine-6-phosphate deacetylase